MEAGGTRVDALEAALSVPTLLVVVATYVGVLNTFVNIYNKYEGSENTVVCRA